MNQNEKETSRDNVEANQNFQNVPYRNSSDNTGANPNGPNYGNLNKKSPEVPAQSSASDSGGSSSQTNGELPPKNEIKKLKKEMKEAAKEAKKEAKLKKKQEKQLSKKRLKEQKELAKEEKNKLKSQSLFSSKLKDFFKSKVAVGTFIIIICFLAVFVISPIISGLVAKRVSVIKVTANLPKGTVIMEENIQFSTVAEIDIPLDAVTSREQILGTFANSDLYSGDVLTDRKLSKVRPLENPYLYELGEGKIALSVSVGGLAEALSGKLKAGDIVSIFTVLNNQSQDDDTESKDAILAESYPELRYVKVLAITNSHTKDINVDEMAIDAKDNDIVPSTLTLEVHPYQARILVGLNKNAIIHVGLVVRSEQKALADECLDVQSNFIEDFIKTEKENRQFSNDIYMDDITKDGYVAGVDGEIIPEDNEDNEETTSEENEESDATEETLTSSTTAGEDASNG